MWMMRWKIFRRKKYKKDETDEDPDFCRSLFADIRLICYILYLSLRKEGFMKWKLMLYLKI